MFNSVNELLNNGYNQPVIFLFGENEFLREEAQNKLINKLITNDDDGFNFDVFDGDDAKLGAIVDLCRSYPMMSDRRVVLVKRFEKLFSGRASKKSESNSPISSYLNKPSSSTVLILVAETEGIRDVYKALKSGNKDTFAKKISSLKFPYNQILAKAVWMEFPKVWESEFPRWAESRIKEKGRKIQPEALDILVSRTKQTLRDLSNEIEKLLLATEGKTTITLDDVNFLTGSTREFNVFELQKSIAERNISKSVLIMNKILAVDKQEMLMIAIYSKFFINLFKIYDEYKNNNSHQVLAQKLGISTFQFNDYMTALKKYNQYDIERAIIAICETDSKLKSSNPDSLMIMQNMLFEIMEGGNANFTLL